MTALAASPEDAILKVASKYQSLSLESFLDLPFNGLDLVPLKNSDKTGRFTQSMWRVGGCIFVDNHTGFFQLGRRLKRTRSEEMESCIILQRFKGGGTRGTLAGDSIHRRPGPVYVMDMALDWEGIRSVGQLQSIYVPKTLIGYQSLQDPGFLEISESTPVGRCLHSEMDAAYKHLHRQRTWLPEPALQRLLSCLKLAVRNDHRRGDIRTHARDALFTVICAHIDRNLESPDLTTESLLRDFGTSRATLYRMFEEVEGVRAYITRRRALKAVLAISQSSSRRGAVAEISERFGFSSTANFNRTIRRLYGNSPGALFCAPRGAEAMLQGHPASTTNDDQPDSLRQKMLAPAR